MLSAVGEGRVEFGRKRCRRLDFYVGIVQRLRMYVAFILFYGQAVGKIIHWRDLYDQRSVGVNAFVLASAEYKDLAKSKGK